MEGEGRGRARGRARMTKKEGAVPQSEPTRKPGMPQPGRGNIPATPTQQPSQQAQQQPQAAGLGVQPGRGVSRTEEIRGEAARAGTDPEVTLGRGSIRGGRGAKAEIVHTRPPNVASKKGVIGTNVRMTANYFRLLHHTDWCLYQYRVDFSPDEDRTHVRKAILRRHKDKLGGYIFDGTVMYTAQRLHPDSIELFSKRNDDDTETAIRIVFVGQVSMGDYQYLQFFNILMRRCYEGLNLQLVGRNFFDPIAKVDIREYKLQLWPGYTTSIRQHESGIMMCAEITHKVMRMDTAFDVLIDCSRTSSRNVREEFAKKLVGNVVLTDYNNKTYRVDDVDWTMTPRSTFKKKTGEDITFIQYYQDRYKIRIKDEGQPMLISRSREKDVRAGCPQLQALVPELCRTTGLNDDMRNNFQLMRKLAEHTRVSPELRIKKLLAFNQRLNTTPETVAVLKEWQMGLGNTLIEFGGRVLPPEKIVLGNNMKVEVNREVDWTRDLRSNPMLTIVNLSNWVVVFPNRCSQAVPEFVKILMKAASSMRFNIRQPHLQEIPNDRSVTYTDAIEGLINKGGIPDLIMIVVPNQRLDLYSAIKKKCCVDRAVATQVILAKNLQSKGVMSIATKVAIQINCKIGGAPWSVEVPLSGMMVFGFDVCHDTSNRNRSFGALVASLDRNMTKYFSAVSHHSHGEELANNMVMDVTKAVHKYQQYNNGAFPARIMFYRDGVGDGQIPYVYNTEVEQVKEALQKIYGTEPVKMCYIIVSKRINTRLFTNGGNPAPGTVCDDVITLPERYDFFLVSQTVKQGTVSPTSYNVINDSVGLEPDKIQRFTYKLTHLYYNWSGTCRVPAPCQYAHKLAFLVGQSLQRSPNQSLEDTLYFL